MIRPGMIPTKEEYTFRIKQMQEKEKNGKRYAKIYSFLQEDYMHRGEEILEEELFQIVGKENLTYKDVSVITKRYTVLTKFMYSLSEEQINANIFLRRANDYIKYSLKDCKEILTDLFRKMDFPSSKKIEDSFYILKFSLKQKEREIIPSKVSETIEILNCQSKFSSVPILDTEHIKVYKEYNEYVEILNQLAINIYFLQMNRMASYFLQMNHKASLYPERIFATSFKICGADSTPHGRYFSVTFEILKQENKGMIDAKTFTDSFMAKLDRNEFLIERERKLEKTEITEEFIKKTIGNYRKLLELGIIEEATKEEKGTQKVKK